MNPKPFTIALVLISSTALGQDSDMAKGQPPRLTPVFSDDFSEDTRSAYVTSGNVDWQRGKLTLGGEATLERAIDGGNWATVELVLEPLRLRGDGHRPEFRFWFLLSGATNCYVRIRPHTDARRSDGTVAVVDTGESDGRPVERVVRETRLADGDIEQIHLEYRHGLLRVSLNKNVALRTHIENGYASIAGLRLDARSRLAIEQLAARASSSAGRELNDVERRQLISAEAASGEVIRMFRAGEFAKATEVAEGTLQIRSSILGKVHCTVGETLNNLAVLYYSTGDYSRAETHAKQAIEVYRSVLGEEHPDYAGCLDTLSQVYQSMGDYVRAEPICREAIEIQRSVLGDGHLQYAISLSSRAGLYIKMGDHARAEPDYKRALEIYKAELGVHHPNYAAGLNNLAILYQEIGDNARAEPLCRQATEILKEALGEKHPSYATSLTSLALLYVNQGDYAKAEPLLVQVADILRSTLGQMHPMYAAALNNLAGLYSSMENYTEAEGHFRRAMEIQRSLLGQEHPDYALALYNLGGLYQDAREYARAEPLISQALKIVRENLNNASVVQSERQQKRNQSKDRHYLDTRLANALRVHPPTAGVLESVWRWKGAVTFRQRAYRQLASNPKLGSTFDSLQSVSRQLSSIAGQVPIPPPDANSGPATAAYARERERWQKQLGALMRKREDLEQRVAADSAEFRELGVPITVSEVQKLLPARTAFVDFLDYDQPATDPANNRTTTERRYVAFVVRPDREPAILGLHSVESIRTTVLAFRSPLAGAESNTAHAQRAAHSLRRDLWLPLAEHLDGIETVIVSPDTALGTLPFGALPGETPGSYLLEQYRFASLPLVGMLRSLFDESTERPQPEKGLLILGDVNYDANSLIAKAKTKQDSRPAWIRRSAPRSEESGWTSLPGFQQELAIVRDQFESKFGGGVTTLRKDKATEAEFIKQASRHYNLHLITHGYFADPEFAAMGNASDDDESRAGRSQRSQLAASKTINQYLPGLLSGLVFAGANNPPPADDPQADGILTASEIETLNLGGVDLVVLSACETGLGKTAGGEGLTGLQRAFHIAGARSVVATLWEVDDKATQEIMSRFYRNYWEKGQSKIDALRNAQLDILRNPSLIRGAPVKTGTPIVDAAATKQERTDARYWAAFQLSGDWQ